MANYYSGMMNNKFGYGELRHGRTKGSRNGYSTTPGYVAIGKKAQGPKEKQIKRNTSTGKSIISKYLSDELGRYGYIAKIASAAIDKYGQNARRIPSVMRNRLADERTRYKIDRAKEQKENEEMERLVEKYRLKNNTGKPKPKRNTLISNNDIKRFHGMSGLGKLGFAADKFGRIYTDSASKWRHGEARKDTNAAKNYWQQIGGILAVKDKKSEDFDRARSRAEKIADDAKKENKLRAGYLAAEKYCLTLTKQYEGAMKKKRYDIAEKIASKINDAYDKYKQAEYDYLDFRAVSAK